MQLNISPFLSFLVLCPSLLLCHLLPSKVSLYLRLHVECGIVTKTTTNIWHDQVIKFSAHLVMDQATVAEVKQGLEFGQQVNLPSVLAFSPLLLANLFAIEGCVRPFQHLRWDDGIVVFMNF